MLRAEVSSLKAAAKLATKAERTCAWAEKPARTAERERLEGELGRLRTRLERTERESRDREVLAGVKRQEREKQKQGKGAWFMKKGASNLTRCSRKVSTDRTYEGEQRDLLLKARFEALQEKGGKTAVKKAIEKKRKKISSKEKKSRPFAKGEKGEGAGYQDESGLKRRREDESMFPHECRVWNPLQKPWTFKTALNALARSKFGLLEQSS